MYAATKEGKEGSLGRFEASLWHPGPAGPLCVPGNENSHRCWSSPSCSSHGCPKCSIPTNSNEPPPTCDSYIKCEVFPRPQDQSKRMAAVAPCFPTEQSLSSSKWLPPLSSSEEKALIKKSPSNAIYNFSCGENCCSPGERLPAASALKVLPSLRTVQDRV